MYTSLRGIKPQRCTVVPLFADSVLSVLPPCLCIKQAWGSSPLPCMYQGPTTLQAPHLLMAHARPRPTSQQDCTQKFRPQPLPSAPAALASAPRWPLRSPRRMAPPLLPDRLSPTL